MKKILLVILSLALVLSLAACGGSDNSANNSTDAPLIRPDVSSNTPVTSEDAPPTTPGGVTPDLDAAIGGAGKLTDYDEATKQAMIDQAREDGGDMEFMLDGSVVLTDKDGNKSIQNPDGTWTFEDVDGGTAQYGGEWPNNEFTNLLPKPDFTLLGASIDETSFGVAFSGATVEQVKAYVEEVKAAGFTVNANTEDQAVMGMTIYVYAAENEAGYAVEVSYATGTAGINMSKP